MTADSPQRLLDIRQAGAVTVVRLLTRELVHEPDVTAAGKRLLRVVEELGGRLVVVNLADVEHMDSSMVGKLVGLYKAARAHGGRVVLCGANRGLAESLDTLRISRLLHLYPDETAAVQALGVVE